jgi:hypothetical protein
VGAEDGAEEVRSTAGVKADMVPGWWHGVGGKCHRKWDAEVLVDVGLDRVGAGRRGWKQQQSEVHVVRI